jgi:class 3 adenylate cyclase
MALFGALIAHEDHAQRACYAALRLRDELRRYSDELRLSRGLDFAARMGIHSGEVVVGKIGDDLRKRGAFPKPAEHAEIFPAGSNSFQESDENEDLLAVWAV